MGILKFFLALVAAVVVTALFLTLNGATAGLLGLLTFFTILRK